jgi:hypothetical protein
VLSAILSFSGVGEANALNPVNLSNHPQDILKQTNDRHGVLAKGAELEVRIYSHVEDGEFAEIRARIKHNTDEPSTVSVFDDRKKALRCDLTGKQVPQRIVIRINAGNAVMAETVIIVFRTFLASGARTISLSRFESRAGKSRSEVKVHLELYRVVRCWR